MACGFIWSGGSGCGWGTFAAATVGVRGGRGGGGAVAAGSVEEKKKMFVGSHLVNRIIDKR